MPRLTPLPWRTVVAAFLMLGFRETGQRGSHIKLERPGSPRPLIVPRYDEIPVFILSGLIRTAETSRDEFLKLIQLV